MDKYGKQKGQRNPSTQSTKQMPFLTTPAKSTTTRKPPKPAETPVVREAVGDQAKSSKAVKQTRNKSPAPTHTPNTAAAKTSYNTPPATRAKVRGERNSPSRRCGTVLMPYTQPNTP